MAIIKFKRGLDADIPTLELAEPGWAIDTNTLYVGGSAGNQAIAGGGGGMTAHEMTGAYHTASGLSAGCVVRATGATTFVWSKLEHTDLSVVGENDHHNRQHGLTDASDHSASGLSAGCVIRAISASQFAWQKLQHSDLEGVNANQHHNQEHGITSASDHTVGGSAYDLVGLTANSTLGLLKPTHRPDGAEVILKSNSSGWIWPTRLGVGAASPVNHQAFSTRLEYTDLATAPTGGYFSVTLVPSGSVSYTNPFGLFSGIYNDSVESVGDVTGIESDVINSTTGSMGTAIGVVGKISNDGGVSSAIAILASAIINNNSMAAAYGVRVYDQDQATVNYAIHTGAGLNSLGDNLQFRQAATISTTAGKLTLTGASGTRINNNLSINTDIIPYIGAYSYITTTTAGTTAIAGQFSAVATDANLAYGGLFNPQVSRGATVHANAITGFEARPEVAATHSANVTGNVVGFSATMYHRGAGVVSNFYAGQFSQPTILGAGSITNNYGVYVNAITNGTTLNYAIYTNAGDVRLMATANDKIGFYGTTPASKQTVSGAKAGNAALTNLLGCLANLGIITNSTT